MKIKVKVDEPGACLYGAQSRNRCPWMHRCYPVDNTFLGDLRKNPAPTWCPLREGPVIVEAETNTKGEIT